MHIIIIIFKNACSLIIFKHRAATSLLSLLWWYVYWHEGGATWHSHEIHQ